MKKAFLFIFCVLAIFTSCKQDVIFYDISQEIELNEQSILGNVTSIKKIDSTLYAASGLFYTKSTNDVRWETLKAPTDTIVNLAVGEVNSEKYLYLLGKPTGSEEITYSVYARKLSTNGALDNSEWKEITSGVSFLYDNQATTAPNAYITKDNKVYKLFGTSFDDSPVDATCIFGEKINSAVNLGGSDYFLGNPATFANGNYIYVANEKILNYASKEKIDSYIQTLKANPESTENPWSKTNETDDTIISTCLYNNKVYVGTNTGFQISTLKSDGSCSDFTNPASNAESAFGTREIIGIWNFDNENNFFVSVTFKTSSIYDALWGYDSASGKWNLE